MSRPVTPGYETGDEGDYDPVTVATTSGPSQAVTSYNTAHSLTLESAVAGLATSAEILCLVFGAMSTNLSLFTLLLLIKGQLLSKVRWHSG